MTTGTDSRLADTPARYVFRVTARLDPADASGVSVESVSFSELRATEAYLDGLKNAIAAGLDAFNAENVSQARKTYLVSSIHVTD